MRRHAKAPSAGSTNGSGNSRGLFRRALAASFAPRHAIGTTSTPLASANFASLTGAPA